MFREYASKYARKWVSTAGEIFRLARARDYRHGECSQRDILITGAIPNEGKRDARIIGARVSDTAWKEKIVCGS